MRSTSKAAMLLTLLALGEGHRVSRQVLLGALWPDSEEARGSHALSSMLHGLHHMLGDALDGAPPVVHRAGACQLNLEAGVGVDTAYFDALVRTAEARLRAGNVQAAATAFAAAVEMYRGDVWALDDLRATVERERLRAVQLTLLSRLSDQYFERHDYLEALRYAGRLLAADPCREDAHRQVMRCHVRLGERAQALRQYQTCTRILKAEFSAAPGLPDPCREVAARQLRMHAFEALSEKLTAAGRFGGAARAANAAVRAEPLRESAHRALVRVHLAEGNLIEAARPFESFRTLLASELGVPPTASMLRLVRDLPSRRLPCGHLNRPGASEDHVRSSGAPERTPTGACPASERA